MLIIIIFSSALYRESIDSYTITASPNFGSFRRLPGTRYSSIDICRSGQDLAPSLPTVVDNNGLSKQTTEEELSKPLIYQSGVESFVHSQTSGEVYIGHGCSFTQTVFNGILSLS